MLKMYYAEEVGYDGQWKPVKYLNERPSDKTSSGGVRKIRRIKEVSGEHIGLSLTQLQAIYGKDDANENEH